MRQRKDHKQPKGDAWQKLHGKRYNCNCAKCGKQGQKKTMPALYIRKEHEDTMRILCRLCFDCMPGLLDELGVKMPE